MTFGYSYKTSDGIRHEGVFRAPAKEDVFAALREKGIRPIKVWSVAPRPSRRRMLVAGALLVLAAAAVLAVLAAQGRGVRQEEGRSQIYGDPGILQACEARGWADVFEDEGARFLARFAQPGRPVRLSGAAWRGPVVEALAAHPAPVRVRASDGDEVAKMKRMVNGMKRELAQYVADGGTVGGYVGEVLARQRVEEKIVANFKAEFEKLARDATARNREETIARWNAKNVLLRQMGLRTVLIPERLEAMDE